MMIVSFGFLYMAFTSERASHVQRSTLLFATEEHQRVQKQNAEMKLLQITQVLTSHLELEQEEESEMKILYVKMLNAEASGNEKLQKLLPEGEQKAAVLAVFAEIMDDVTAVVGTHERESRKRGAHARALLTHIHDDIIHELEREAAGDTEDAYIQQAAEQSAVPVAANDRAQSAHTREAVDAQLGYLQAKLDAMLLSTASAAAPMPSASELQAQAVAWEAFASALVERAATTDQLTEVAAMARALLTTTTISSPDLSVAAAAVLSIAKQGG